MIQFFFLTQLCKLQLDLQHENAIKQEKRRPPRFSDNPKVPPSKEFGQNPKGSPPLDFQLLCIYGR